MKKKLLYIALISLSGVMLICGCSKDYSSSSTPYPMPAGTTASSVMVTIMNFAFDPDTIRVKTGTTVTWTNMDTTPHTITSLTGEFNSENIPTYGTFQYTFQAMGTFTYHCTIHPMEKSAVVIVSN